MVMPVSSVLVPFVLAIPIPSSSPTKPPCFGLLADFALELLSLSLSGLRPLVIGFCVFRHLFGVANHRLLGIDFCALALGVRFLFLVLRFAFVCLGWWALHRLACQIRPQIHLQISLLVRI